MFRRVAQKTAIRLQRRAVTVVENNNVNLLRRPFSNSIPLLATAEESDDGNFFFRNDHHGSSSSSDDQHLRLAHSVEPIAYSGDMELTPLNHEPNTHNNVSSYLGHKKITVVGCGQIGMAVAYSILNQQSAGTIALVDSHQRERLEGEAKDLEQGSAFHEQVRILASDEYSVSADSHMVVVTAGATQQPGKTNRMDLLEANVVHMQEIIPKILTVSPHATICVVADPCDILTAVAAKIAGPSIPAGRIFGSGTCLDSSRLRSLISKKLDLDTSAVEGYVIGEHGDTSVPVWSSVTVGGVPLLARGQEPTKIHNDLHQQVVESAYDVVHKKGYTNWAVGLTGAHIAKTVVHDTRRIMPVSTCVRGLKGIQEDVFISMPAAIGSTGVQRVIDLPLTDKETSKFLHSVDTIWDVQKELWDNL